MCLPTVKFFSRGLRKRIFSARVRFGRSRTSKVIDFVTNRKRACDFLLVSHGTTLALSCTFSEILPVFCACDRTPIPP